MHFNISIIVSSINEIDRTFLTRDEILFQWKIFQRKVGIKVGYYGEGRGACFFFFREEAHRRLIALVPQAKACIQGFSEAFLAEIVIRDLRGRSGRIFTVSRWLLSEFVKPLASPAASLRERRNARAFHRWKPTGEKRPASRFNPDGNFSNYKRIFLIILYTFLSPPPSSLSKLLPREIFKLCILNFPTKKKHFPF